MVSQKKKLAFYSLLSSGHLNVCISLGKALLTHFSDRIEIYFIVDKVWKERIEKIEPRFKFGVFEFDKTSDESRMVDIVNKLEDCLSMSLIEKIGTTIKMFIEDPTLYEVDVKSEEKLREIKPDYVLADQPWHLPALTKTGIPYGFVTSTNPLLITNGNEGFPKLGSDCGINEKEKMKQFNDEFLPFKLKFIEYLHEFFERRGTKYENSDVPVDQVYSDYLSVYSFPQELDYFDDQIREKYNLIQIDTPLFLEREVKPYKLPKQFASLPGPIVYVSLGSLFSAYTHRLQKLVDALDKLPYRYIVSKGVYGDKLIFPSSKFIGENYVDQLAVLKVVSAMIAHGGNNTLGECFYYGVPCVIMPVLGDQINNAKRIEETGYGERMDLMNFTEEELTEKLNNLLNNDELRLKWQDAKNRIQTDNRIIGAAKRIVEYIENL